MRVLSLPLVAAFLAACPGPPDTVCGQSSTPPTADDVTEGNGRATRSDGAAFDFAGSWSPNASDVVIGTLTMEMPVDESGLKTTDLIADGAFPICVPMGARSETSGRALLPPTFGTDNNTSGGLAILDKDGDTLFGRFSFEMTDSGGTTVSFDDGAFIVDQR